MGDCLEFQCRATDPRGRSIEWHIDTWGAYSIREVDMFRPAAVGETVNLALNITEAMVGERLEVSIFMRSSSRFRLHADFMPYDDVARFVYAVNPPDDGAP